MKKPVILCVDDEKIILNSIKDQIKEKINEYSIEVAESGQEALEIIDEMLEENVEIPIVISDYIMPSMKGDEFLGKVHKIIPNTMKILLTGQATTEGISTAVNKANLYRYISKPWEKDDLCMTIAEAAKSYYMDKQLEKQNKDLIKLRNGIVEIMVTALDTRDKTTSGHSKRIANYAVKFAEAINSIDYGKYKDVNFSKEKIQEIYFSGLLHDIGKIGISESILQKELRLSIEHQNEIMYRFSYYKKCLEIKKLLKEINEQEMLILDNIDHYLSIVLEMSKRSYINKEEIDEIILIHSIKYINPNDELLSLLDDLEVENLTIKTGNLTENERQIINSHVQKTYDILKRIPWTKDLELIPEIAASHHERMDGTGYPRGLKADEILIESRMLAIIDIFDALTSRDRPYRKSVPVSKALNILCEEVELNHLEKDLYEIFVKEKVYNTISDEVNFYKK